jgi:hypothetical protein
MSPEVHAVVQNAGNFDLPVTDNTEEEKVASTTTSSHDVQRVNAFGDFGTKSRSRRRWPPRQIRKGRSKSFRIDTRLL